MQTAINHLNFMFSPYTRQPSSVFSGFESKAKADARAELEAMLDSTHFSESASVRGQTIRGAQHCVSEIQARENATRMIDFHDPANIQREDRLTRYADTIARQR